MASCAGLKTATAGQRRSSGSWRRRPAAVPSRLAPARWPINGDRLPDCRELGLADDGLVTRQRAGRVPAMQLMDSFFGGRGKSYQRGMSSPLTAPGCCSRLSPHLAAGVVSMREAVQRCYAERRALARVPPEHAALPLKAVDALVARLHWHCHFIQKLESAPDLELKPQHAYFASHPAPHDAAICEAWRSGRTGFPFLDACMRYLIATGWINFRMRAMLQSVAHYQLALDWRITGNHLARMFVDYEPGIHWPQVQMQSGQTGINTPRIYNPLKQSLEQDPDGEFIRRWVPELAGLPGGVLHSPWLADAGTLQSCGVRPGVTYPVPVVDLAEAGRARGTD